MSTLNFRTSSTKATRTFSNRGSRAESSSDAAGPSNTGDAENKNDKNDPKKRVGIKLIIIPVALIPAKLS